MWLENSRFTKVLQEQQALYMKTNAHLLLYFPHFFLEWEIFRKKFPEKIKTHFLGSIIKKNRAFYEIMWKSNTQPNRPQITICACLLHAGDLDTYSEYVILIAFPLQQWPQEHSWMLRYTYMSCFIYISFRFLDKRGEDIYFYQM